MTRMKMMHIMDKSRGSVGYAILGIQQRKKQRNMKRKLKTCCFIHVGQLRRHISEPFSEQRARLENKQKRDAS